MEHKFKVGDTVRVSPTDEYPHEGCVGLNSLVEEEATIEEINTEGGLHFYLKSSDGRRVGCFSIAQLTLVTAKRSKHTAPVKFILQYDNDDYQKFTSEKTLRAGIAALAKEPTANRTYTVYDIKRTRTVTLGVKITIK